MGTPALSIPSLRALVDAGHDIRLVVTQPSRHAGRGLRESLPPVGRAAAELGLEIYQPRGLRSDAARARIAAADTEVIVVVAFGRILPPSILALPRRGPVNVHLSLLPRHRGASPISGAILAGDEATGASIMLMDEGLDTGPILAQAQTPIGPDDDEVTLSERLSRLGAALLVDALIGWEAGHIEPRAQDDGAATWTALTVREDGHLDWTDPAISLWRRVRAYAAWPQAFTLWDGKLLRILRAEASGSRAQGPAGSVRGLADGRRPKGIAVATGDGELIPRVLGLEGRKAMPVEAFLRGQPGFVGAQLGQRDGF